MVWYFYYIHDAVVESNSPSGPILRAIFVPSNGFMSHRCRKGFKAEDTPPHTDLQTAERLQGCRRPNMTPGDVIATVTYVCLVFSCASVSLRIVVRHKWLDHGLKLDDWLMIVALVSGPLTYSGIMQLFYRELFCHHGAAACVAMKFG